MSNQKEANDLPRLSELSKQLIRQEFSEALRPEFVTLAQNLVVKVNEKFSNSINELEDRKRPLEEYLKRIEDEMKSTIGIAEKIVTRVDYIGNEVGLIKKDVEEVKIEIVSLRCFVDEAVKMINEKSLRINRTLMYGLGVIAIINICLMLWQELT